MIGHVLEGKNHVDGVNRVLRRMFESNGNKLTGR
jgi:hypothetical protein